MSDRTFAQETILRRINEKAEWREYFQDYQEHTDYDVYHDYDVYSDYNEHW